MTARGNLEQRVATHYASQAPLLAPDRVLLAALSTIDTTRQRRGIFAPWRYTHMSTNAKLAAAAVVAVAIGLGALGLLQGAGPAAPAATPTSAPASAPSQTPIPDAIPRATDLTGTAREFVVPFSYVIPGTPRFDFGAADPTYWEIRVPAWADAGAPGGMVVQAVGGGRSDPCDSTSRVVSFGSGLARVSTYLQSIAELTITSVTESTVDSRPAWQARVKADLPAACSTFDLWTEDGESFINGVDLRLIVVDVGGEHVAITIYGEPGNPEWPAIADAIIASFDFDAT